MHLPMLKPGNNSQLHCGKCCLEVFVTVAALWQEAAIFQTKAGGGKYPKYLQNNDGTHQISICLLFVVSAIRYQTIDKDGCSVFNLKGNEEACKDSRVLWQTFSCYMNVSLIHAHGYSYIFINTTLKNMLSLFISLFPSLSLCLSQSPWFSVKHYLKMSNLL